MKHTQF
jgi:hypothetical protein